MSAQPKALRLLAFVPLSLLVAGLASPATPPKLTDLGALVPETGVASFAVGLNDRGQIVGMAFDPVDWNRYSAIVWQPGPSGLEGILLGSAGGPVHYELSIPDNWGGAQRAVNRDGFIVGRAWDSSAGQPLSGPIIWREEAPGTFVPSYLPGPKSASARALNGTRQIIGGGRFWASEGSDPASLPVPAGFDLPDAYDINDAGQVVGVAYEASSSAEHAMLWEPDGQGGFVPTVLPGPDQATFTVPSAISNHGQVVGYALGGGIHVAVAWQKNAGGWALNVLEPPEGCGGASAYGVNDSGMAVGTAVCDTSAVAVLWMPDGAGGLESTVLPAEGEGFSNAYAQSLNNRGQIVGATWKCPVQGTTCGWNALMWEADTTPPTIANATASPAVLWPPNHKLVGVTIGYDAADESGSVECSLGPITADEALTESDWSVLDAHHVRLMSERGGSGSGRIYTVPINCVDPSGHTATARVTVTVPHDRR